MVTRKRTKQRSEPASTPQPFHERFEIQIGMDDAKRRFMNRVKDRIFENFFEGHLRGQVKPNIICWSVANALGEEYSNLVSVDYYVRGDFYRCLQVLEASYGALTSQEHRLMLSAFINMVPSESEIELGISWQPPTFVRTGARLLDTRLVNEPLRWLSNPKYRSVYSPFEKGLSHFLEAEKKPHLLADVVTDMYESKRCQN